MRTTEDIFYQIGKLAFLPFTAGMLFLNRMKPSALGGFPACAFWQMTGYFCPGCGGTRSFFSLAHGRLAEAFWYHPFVPYAVSVYMIFMGICFFRRHAGGRRTYRPIKIEGFFYIGIAVLLLQWLLKNLGILAL